MSKRSQREIDHHERKALERLAKRIKRPQWTQILKKMGYSEKTNAQLEGDDAT